jgi:hypothetical protein
MKYHFIREPFLVLTNRLSIHSVGPIGQDQNFLIIQMPGLIIILM